MMIWSNIIMKYKGLIIMLIISLTLFGLTACDKTKAPTPQYEQISAQQAKELMDTQKDYIIIDARTQEEFDEGHIQGAILIPEYEITNCAEDKLLNKDQLILVYCRSGRRSKIASQALVDLGYTNVKEFGGIIDWPYEIVK
jgi:rhodanese-related sulfurtransferase